MLEFHLKRVKYSDQTEYLYMLIQDIVINHERFLFVGKVLEILYLFQN